MNLAIEASKLLQETIEASQDYKFILHSGGSRSSKTYSILLFFIVTSLAHSQDKEKLIIRIARDTFKSVKETVLTDFESICIKYNLNVSPSVNCGRPDQKYQLGNAEIHFIGLDNAGKLHGMKQGWFWLNEVMEITRDKFDQLKNRTSIGAILDYNPWDDTHWVFDLLKRNDVIEIHSTMYDNPFLEETIIKEIESYEPTLENYEKGTADVYMWDVYGLGKTARLRGVIFENIKVVDSIPLNAECLGAGLDFGFSNDPTAFIMCYKYDGELYFDELIFQTNLINQDTINLLETYNIDKNMLIVADSAEPKSIEEIYRAGFNYTVGAYKGKDSIVFGINLLKKFKINITSRSENLLKEFKKYKWAEGRDGKTINVPVGKFNHGIDAIRYLTTHVLESKVQVVTYSPYDIY